MEKRGEGSVHNFAHSRTMHAIELCYTDDSEERTKQLDDIESNSRANNSNNNKSFSNDIYSDVYNRTVSERYIQCVNSRAKLNKVPEIISSSLVAQQTPHLSTRFQNNSKEISSGNFTNQCSELLAPRMGGGSIIIADRVPQYEAVGSSSVYDNGVRKSVSKQFGDMTQNTFRGEDSSTTTAGTTTTTTTTSTINSSATTVDIAVTASSSCSSTTGGIGSSNPTGVDPNDVSMRLVAMDNVRSKLDEEGLLFNDAFDSGIACRSLFPGESVWRALGKILRRVFKSNEAVVINNNKTAVHKDPVGGYEMVIVYGTVKDCSRIQCGLQLIPRSSVKRWQDKRW